jgi:hypothetical protein
MLQRLKETEIGLNKIPEKEISLARAVGHRHDRGGKQESNRPRGQQRDRRDIECHYCHKKGHYKKDCWSLNGKTNSREHQQQPQQPQRVTENAAAAWGARYQAAFTYQKGIGRPEHQEWVLDSGCTRHMTFDRRHFVDYRKESGIVTLADGKIL